MKLPDGVLQLVTDTSPRHKESIKLPTQEETINSLPSCRLVLNIFRTLTLFNKSHPNVSRWLSLHEQPSWDYKLPCERVCVAQWEQQPPAPQICPNLSCNVAQAWRPAGLCWYRSILLVVYKQLGNVSCVTKIFKMNHVANKASEETGHNYKWRDYFAR